MNLRRFGERIGAIGPNGLVRGFWITLAVVVTFFGLTTGVIKASASHHLCNRCHEMQPEVASWKMSPHTRVGCASCHETPRPWYKYSETLIARGAKLKRDIDLHLANRTGSSKGAKVDIPDSTCLQCHDLSRKVSIRFGTLIDHAEHAKRNKSCLSCHLSTAHPQEGHDKRMLLMERCFQCHGRGPKAEAPGACSVCHPKSFKLRPAAHGTAAAWRTRHGKAAKADRKQCLMCHEEKTCTGCHGLQMPHPTRWAASKTGHMKTPKDDWRACAKCHERGPDLCSMCHHQGHEPAMGSWVAQHPPTVDKRGAAFCMGCHERTFCSFCHTDRSLTVSAEVNRP